MHVPFISFTPAIEEILEDSDYEYRSRLMLVSTSQKEVLYAIARTGIASRVTSSAFIGKHKLTSASSVQSAIRKLLADGWISETIIDGTRHYQLNDLFLCLWIQKIWNGLSALAHAVPFVYP